MESGEVEQAAKVCYKVSTLHHDNMSGMMKLRS